MVLIRADGNSSIGVGHVMRCLSIADALKIKDIEVIFATADDNMKSIIEDRGFSCIVLNSDYRYLKTDFNNEQFAELINKSDVILVDSYYVSEEYFTLIRDLTKSESDSSVSNNKIIYIDDLCEKAYPVDIVINYNIYANQKKYDCMYNSKNYKTDFVLGPGFTPLRREFSEAPRIEIKEKVTDVLIATGGADIYHTSLELIKTLKEYRENQSNNFLDNICFHFVVGGMSEDYDSILNEIRGINYIVIHRNVKDMTSLMLSCDIAVSAAGTTLYELCACGVPTITYVLADNQIEGEITFVDSGAMLSVGDIRNNNRYCLDIYEKINMLASDCELRKEMSRIQSDLVSSEGAERLANKIEHLQYN